MTLWRFYSFFFFLSSTELDHVKLSFIKNMECGPLTKEKVLDSNYDNIQSDPATPKLFLFVYLLVFRKGNHIILLNLSGLISSPSLDIR